MSDGARTRDNRDHNPVERKALTCGFCQTGRSEGLSLMSAGAFRPLDVNKLPMVCRYERLAPWPFSFTIMAWGPTVPDITVSTLPCTTCGHQVAPSARRCPSCNEKRPAPTAANAVKALIGLVVLVVVLIAVVAGHGGGSKDASPAQTQAALTRLSEDDGTCLAQAGVSTVGAYVQMNGDGSALVTLGDGAQFTVPKDPAAIVVTANPKADGDILAANDC